MEIAEAQKIIDDWIKKYGVRYFSELTNTAILMEEVGEVARIMARRFGEQSEKENDKHKSLEDALERALLKSPREIPVVFNGLHMLNCWFQIMIDSI